MAAIRRGPIKRGLDENDEKYLRIFLRWKNGEPMNHSAEKEGLKPTRGRQICLTVEENFENGFFKISSFGVTTNSQKLIPTASSHIMVLGIRILVMKKTNQLAVYNFYFPYKTWKNLKRWANEQWEGPCTE